jgi:hypothetical protein
MNYFNNKYELNWIELKKLKKNGQKFENIGWKI